MPNRPICAEDALLSETPMPPEQILRYLDRIGLRDAVPPPPTLETLRRLQSAHLLYVPYENLDLLRGAITSLEHGALFEKIVPWPWRSRSYYIRIHLTGAGYTASPAPFCLPHTSYRRDRSRPAALYTQ